MTTASPTKAEERHAILDQYSQESVLTTTTNQFDLFYGMSVFSWTGSHTDFIGSIEWTAETFLSRKILICTFTGLNIGGQVYLDKGFDTRIKDVADRIGHSPTEALAYWRRGITAIAELYVDAMRVKEALDLIAAKDTPAEAGAALRWLTDEYIEAHRVF